MRSKLRMAALLLLGVLAGTCHGHGFLTSPRSRAVVIGRADWEAAGGNGLGTAPYRAFNDQADVCGDP